MRIISDRIREKVDAAEYEEAYFIGRAALEECASDVEVIAALSDLTERLRSKCMGLAAQKKDCGPEYHALESLLIEASKLTGQDIYGHKIDSSTAP